MTDGPFFLLVRPGVSQLHQDHEGVDGHRPNHYQVVRGRPNFNRQEREQEQV